MKYKQITDMTDQEIEFLWKDIFNVNKIIRIERRINENEIEVSFETSWGNNDDKIEIEDTVIMYSDDFDEPDFQLAENDKFEYRQYMIAKGYSSYWKDNKYAEQY